MSKFLRIMLVVLCMIVILGVALFASILIMRPKIKPPTQRERARLWFTTHKSEFETEIQVALLDCANASDEEYIALRDALIPIARGKPEAFRFAAALWRVCRYC